MVIVEVTPQGYKSSGQIFEAKVEGHVVASRSTTPLCDAARFMLSAGMPPTAQIVMRHQGRTDNALRSTVGVAAKMAVFDGSDGTPRFAKWKPNVWKGI